MPWRQIKGVVAAIKYFYESGGQSPSKEELKREKGFVRYVKRPASMHKR